MREISFVQALEVTAFAMLIVFAVLIILALIIKGQTLLINNIESLVGKNKNSNKDSLTRKNMDVENKDNININDEENLELVAVIMGAVSCHMNVSSEKLVIKNIRRVNNNWKNSAIRSNLR